MAYLAHWAVRLFSEDAGLARRLGDALRARGGTLAVSWINLGEFSKVSDTMQANQTEQFLDRLLPHLFFLDSDPSKVIQRENDFIAGTKRVLPHADQELLGEVKNLKPSGVQALTVVGLLDSFFGSTLVDRGEALGDTFVKVVEDLR